MTPTVRSQTRTLTLASALSHSAMKGAWKSTVRHGLRRQPIRDWHDYMDIHRRLSTVVSRLHNEVVSGTYRPSDPEFVRLEKNLGVSRRVVIPAAEDAIVLQTLIDQLEQRILSRAPSGQVYYSRSHAPPSVYHIDHTFPYPWWELWPEFQERIWKFAQDHNYVVMTDIANYFDAIPLQSLRNRLVSLARVEEEMADFLFFLLDGYVWRPDYVPHSGVGLPQIQFDAPRLLAHCYLFEADTFLEKQTSRSFVRWMDDINIGVSFPGEGKRILRDLDEMLATMGLHLNAGKTKILSGKEATKELWMNENRKLNALENIVQQGNMSGRTGPYARKQFRRFWRRERVGAWSKVLRRYLTVFTKLEDSFLERWVPEMLHNIPRTRDKVVSYYKVLRYHPRRFKHIVDFVSSTDCTDDVAYCSVMDLLVSWDIPPRSQNRRRALQLVHNTWRKDPESQPALGAALGVVAKFAPSSEVLRFVEDSARIWRRSEWAARQVAAVTPVLTPRHRGHVVRMIQRFRLREAVDVMIHLRQLGSMRRLDQQLRMYLLQPSGTYPYPFEKVLISMALLKGSLQDPDRTVLQDHFRLHVDDTRFKNLIAGC